MRVILLILLFSSHLLASHPQLDSLEKELARAKSDTERLQVLSNLNWEYLPVNVERSKYFAEREIELAKKIGNHKYIAQGYNDLGISLMRQGNFTEAVKLHEEALKIRRKIKDKTGVASSLSKIGGCYTELDDYKKALAAQLEALQIYQDLGHAQYMAYTLNNISSLYEELRDYKKVLQYAQQSYELLKNTGDKAGIANALAYISMGVGAEKDYERAIDYQKQALELRTAISDSDAMAASLNNIGYYYRLLNDPGNAERYYAHALELAKRTKDKRSEALYNNNLGNVFMDKRDFDKAEVLLRKGLEQSLAENVRSMLILSYKSLGDLFALTGRGDSAIHYYNLYTDIQDSLFTADLAAKMSEMQAVYEVEKREKEKELLSKDVALKSAELARSRATTGLLLIALALISIVSYLLYNRYRLKQKALLQKEMLHQQELRTKAVIDAEENERVRIARELHDGIGQQLSAAKLNISGLRASGNNASPLLDNAIELIDDAVKEVRAVSHSMMANELTRNGLPYALQSLTQKINASGSIQIHLEVEGLEERLDPTTEIIIYRITQEMLSNAIRHSGGDQVTLQVVKHPEEIVVIAEDNGRGFDPAHPTYAEGVGLKNMRSRVEYLQGSFTIDSYPGKGTSIVVEIPSTKIQVS